MVSDSQKRKAIREFLIPDTLKDDIAYCQRSLRDCVKVHQVGTAGSWQCVCACVYCVVTKNTFLPCPSKE